MLMKSLPASPSPLLRHALLIAVALLIGWSLPPWAAAAADEGLPGKLLPASETRSLLRTIDTIEMNGPVDLVVRQSAVPTLVVKSEQRLLEQIRTHQEGRTLSISVTGPTPASYRPMRVEVGLPTLQYLRLAGTGDTQVSGLSGERLKLEQSGRGDTVIRATYENVEASLSGAGDFTLQSGPANSISLSISGRGDARIDGRAKTFTASLRGSGDLNARALAAEVVTLALSGSGDALVTASQAVTILSRGRGDVVVFGQPVQKVLSRSGSGSVVFR